MKHLPVLLNDLARETVSRTIQAHCELRKWELHATNVRSNHVHVVVSVGEISPEKVISQLKAWTTRRLRESGQIMGDAPAWTEDGSKRYLWTQGDVVGAVEYVLERQGPEFH
jgi:REP element-mobilizing transposase RayT